MTVPRFVVEVTIVRDEASYSQETKSIRILRVNGLF